jgi:uncharacterized protein (DUF1697 family)
VSQSRHIVLLRGINLGPNRRVAMPRLREVLEQAGFEDVRTYVQSGNIVLSSGDPSDAVAATCERVIAEEFGFDVPVVVRTRDELAPNPSATRSASLTASPTPSSSRS